jgi:hypothetical protein
MTWTMTWTSRVVGVLCLGLLVVVVATVVTAGHPGNLLDDLARFLRSTR